MRSPVLVPAAAVSVFAAEVRVFRHDHSILGESDAEDLIVLDTLQSEFAPVHRVVAGAPKKVCQRVAMFWSTSSLTRPVLASDVREIDGSSGPPKRLSLRSHMRGQAVRTRGAGVADVV
jgi:hypothetical protein